MSASRQTFRRSAASEEDWFGPGMDLMMSLFTILAGVLALVLWQKTRLEHRNETLTEQVKKITGNPADPDKTITLKSYQELLAENTRLKDELDEARKKRGDIDLKLAQRAQKALVSDMANTAGFIVELRNDNSMLLTDGGDTVVTVINDGYLQTLRFGADTLFRPSESKIPPGGKAEAWLNTVAKAIAGNAPRLKEIQIHGHADNTRPTPPATNLDLSTQRAITVYNIFAPWIDPSSHLMSIGSYAEYKPVSRVPGAAFDSAALQNANTSESDRALNRRVEVFLIYNTQGENGLPTQ